MAKGSPNSFCLSPFFSQFSLSSSMSLNFWFRFCEKGLTMQPARSGICPSKCPSKCTLPSFPFLSRSSSLLKFQEKEKLKMYARDFSPIAHMLSYTTTELPASGPWVLGVPLSKIHPCLLCPNLHSSFSCILSLAKSDSSEPP